MTRAKKMRSNSYLNIKFMEHLTMWQIPILMCGFLASSLLSSCDSKINNKRGRHSSSSTGNIEVRNQNKGEQTDDEGNEALISNEESTSFSLAPEIIMWKRYRAFEDGLSQGLSLDKNQMCLEMGQHSCIDKVHLTVLGGNEPYTMGQYESARTPTVLTGVAVERIVLAACSARLALDKALGASAVVFKDLPLTGSEVTTTQIKAQTARLYQKLLSRDAASEELNISQELLKIATSPEKVALALCFMVGTQIENIFL